MAAAARANALRLALITAVLLSCSAFSYTTQRTTGLTVVDVEDSAAEANAFRETRSSLTLKLDSQASSISSTLLVFSSTGPSIGSSSRSSKAVGRRFLLSLRSLQKDMEDKQDKSKTSKDQSSSGDQQQPTAPSNPTLPAQNPPPPPSADTPSPAEFTPAPAVPEPTPATPTPSAETPQVPEPASSEVPPTAMSSSSSSSSDTSAAAPDTEASTPSIDSKQDPSAASSSSSQLDVGSDQVGKALSKPQVSTRAKVWVDPEDSPEPEPVSSPAVQQPLLPELVIIVLNLRGTTQDTFDKTYKDKVLEVVSQVSGMSTDLWTVTTEEQQQQRQTQQLLVSHVTNAQHASETYSSIPRRLLLQTASAADQLQQQQQQQLLQVTLSCNTSNPQLAVYRLSQPPEKSSGPTSTTDTSTSSAKHSSVTTSPDVNQPGKFTGCDLELCEQLVSAGLPVDSSSIEIWPKYSFPDSLIHSSSSGSSSQGAGVDRHADLVRVRELAIIIVGSVGGFVLLLVLAVNSGRLINCCYNSCRRRPDPETRLSSKSTADPVDGMLSKSTTSSSRSSSKKIRSGMVRGDKHSVASASSDDMHSGSCTEIESSSVSSTTFGGSVGGFSGTPSTSMSAFATGTTVESPWASQAAPSGMAGPDILVIQQPSHRVQTLQ